MVQGGRNDDTDRGGRYFHLAPGSAGYGMSATGQGKRLEIAPKNFLHDHLESMAWSGICCKQLILHIVTRIHVCQRDLACILWAFFPRPKLGIVKELSVPAPRRKPDRNTKPLALQNWL